MFVRYKELKKQLKAISAKDILVFQVPDDSPGKIPSLRACVLGLSIDSRAERGHTARGGTGRGPGQDCGGVQGPTRGRFASSRGGCRGTAPASC